MNVIETVPPPSLPSRFVHIFFMDGVGLGGPDPDVNPFITAELPNLTGLLGEGWFLQTDGRTSTERATLAATDANMSMPYRPQSATGQATILTGRNVAQLVGEHYGPKPNKPVAEVIHQGTLFHEIVEAGGKAALLTPYPQGYFDAIQSGKRLYSAVPLAAVIKRFGKTVSDSTRRPNKIGIILSGGNVDLANLPW